MPGCLGSEEEVKPDKLPISRPNKQSHYDHAMLNGSRAQMGCQLAVARGFTNLSQARPKPSLAKISDQELSSVNFHKTRSFV